MATTTSIQVELGAAFWLLMFPLIAGMIMWAKLGTDKMGRVINGGLGDAFRR